MPDKAVEVQKDIESDGDQPRREVDDCEDELEYVSKDNFPDSNEALRALRWVGTHADADYPCFNATQMRRQDGVPRHAGTGGESGRLEH